MFQHNMSEAQNHEVDIQDRPSSTVHLMLEYIYSSQFQHSSNTEDLLPAADKYELTQLKSACELSLSRTVLSDIHSASQLQKACLEFTVNNLNKIMSSLSWKSKLSSHPRDEPSRDEPRRAETRQAKQRQDKTRQAELTNFSFKEEGN